eukprot:gene13930-15382_t
MNYFGGSGEDQTNADGILVSNQNGCAIDVGADQHKSKCSEINPGKHLFQENGAMDGNSKLESSSTASSFENANSPGKENKFANSNEDTDSLSAGFAEKVAAREAVTLESENDDGNAKDVGCRKDALCDSKTELACPGKSNGFADGDTSANLDTSDDFFDTVSEQNSGSTNGQQEMLTKSASAMKPLLGEDPKMETEDPKIEKGDPKMEPGGPKMEMGDPKMEVEDPKMEAGGSCKTITSISDCATESLRTFHTSDCKLSLSSMDETSNLSSISTCSNVTQRMVDEEEQYIKEDEEEFGKVKGKGIQELEEAPEDQRFDRLKNLLDKSNVYAQFLLKRMDQQREDDKERREKKLKVQEKRAKKREEKTAMVSSSQESPGRSQPTRSTREKKRKREDEATKHPTGKKGSKKRKVQSNQDDSEQVVPEIEEDEVEESSQDVHGGESNENIGRIINGDVVSERQPSLITGGVLRSYQLDGMEWLRGLYENGINGILADEMGLGKTLQCMSLIAYLIEQGIRGPFLVAAPLSTLPNWMAEFKRFCPKIVTLLYHGSKEERAAKRLKITRLVRIDEKAKIKSFPVVITSYEIIMRDRADLYNHHWKYIIIDEGHRIKNLNCRLIRELKTYKTANRLLLTGTPLQNNLAELWSLLNFLLPDIFDDLYSFQEWFDFSAVEEDGGHEKIIAQEQEEHVLETLHAILTPFLLRRLKTDVDLSIPPKRELIVYAPLTKEQQEYYTGTLNRTILDKIKKKKTPAVAIEYTNSGRPKRKSTTNVKKQQAAKASQSNKLAGSVVSIKMQNILMQLRKCCNHPYLLEYPLDPVTQNFKVDEDVINVSGKMRVLDRMLAELKKRGHKVLVFSQMTSMLDIIQDFCYWRSYEFSRLDGTMAIPERQEMIERFNNDPDVFLFLLSTRAGGLGINLSAADTCIIYDSDWNPQADLQAQDRCHRIGQKKPVLVFRLVTANTVDETVVERAASKRKLEKMVIHKGRFKGRQVSNKLSPLELLDLLKSKEHGQFSGEGDENIITDECLDKLLDRSFFNSSNNPQLSCRSKNQNTDNDDNNNNNEIFKVVDNQTSDALF